MRESWRSRGGLGVFLRGVSDLQDPCLMADALSGLRTEALRTACRSRRDIPRGDICNTFTSVMRFSPKECLISLLVQSLSAHPVPVEVSRCLQDPLPRKTKRKAADMGEGGKTKLVGVEGLPTRVMETLIRSLGRLWMEPGAMGQGLYGEQL